MWKVTLVAAVCGSLLGSIVCPPVKPEKVKKQGAERSEEMVRHVYKHFTIYI